MKNLKKSILVVLMLLSLGIAKAQGSKREKMEALKVAFITEKLDLTAEEAKAFWPLYNEFSQKRKALSKGMEPGPEGPPPPGNEGGRKSKKPDFDNMTDAEITAFIDEKHGLEQKMLDLKVEYMAKYKKVLPIRKIAKLFPAEKDFRKEILKKMRENQRK